jgi:hypothetical protein
MLNQNSTWDVAQNDQRQANAKARFGPDYYSGPMIYVLLASLFSTFFATDSDGHRQFLTSDSPPTSTSSVSREQIDCRT